MIAKMKKMTLIVSEGERDTFLKSLRKAGVVHLKGIKALDFGDLHALEKDLSSVDKALEALNGLENAHNGTPPVPGEENILKEAIKLANTYDQKTVFEQEKNVLENKLTWFEKWGKIDIEDIRLLKDAGAHIRLYELSRDEFRKLRDKDPVTLLGKDKHGMRVASISNDPEKKLPYQEVKFPPESYGSVTSRIKELDGKIEEYGVFIKNKARLKDELEGFKRELSKKKEFLTVKYGMRDETGFSYLQGFCPAKNTDKVMRCIDAHGAGYIMDDAGDPAETPTLITNPKWIDIIKPVFTFMNTLPGYDEFDISLPFLVFFSLFFAMLVGDAGYGVLFLLMTFFARRKMKKSPPQPFHLMYLLSFGTIAWGAVTGTWFGAEGIARLPGFNALVISGINSFVDTNQDFMMYLCFIIGAVHLTIAHLTRGFKVINSLRALADAGWVLVIWGMFFTAGTLIINKPFPGFAGYFLIAGTMMVLVFANFQKNIIKGMLTTLTNLPLDIIAAFADVVSYLRLFAVGYASVIVAESFNSMAIGEGITSLAGGIIAALILFFGHALNIVLALMAVVVHGIRLNMLEFSGHLGMQWSGKEYKPFKE